MNVKHSNRHQNGSGRGKTRRFETGAVNPLHLIHKWSIEHPYVVMAFTIAVIAVSIIAVTRTMPRRFAPYVQSPLVGVVTMMPGLSAREMETYVSKPIEEQMQNVRGLRAVRSNSQDGFSLVTLEFPYGTNMERSVVDVQSLLNVTQANLPATGANLKPSFVIPIDPLNLPFTTLSLRGDASKGWDMTRVREFADNTALTRLKGVAGVHAVVPFGGYRRQMQVLVDRQKLAAYGLSILEVRDAIDRFNVARPAGVLTQGAQEGIVRVDTLARNSQDVLNYPIKTVGTGATAVAVPIATSGGMGGGGMSGQAAPVVASNSASNGPAGAPKVVYVRDVARVIDSHFERRSAYHFMTHEAGKTGEVVPSISLSVVQDPGGSSAQVVPAVMEVARQLERENPGLHFETAYDNASFVDILFENIWHELTVAVVLTALAVLFFLGEWRGTLIAMITVPTSLALAVLMMMPFGMTFNSGTLIGLLLCIGRLVDDSIIDIHAVERHLKMGKDPTPDRQRPRQPHFERAGWSPNPTQIGGDR